MTQEDKQLLLKDLCMRLPYKVFCEGISEEYDDVKDEFIPLREKGILSEINAYKHECCDVTLGLFAQCDIETIKPYLRPMNSITDDEYKELGQLLVDDNPNLNLDEISATIEIDWLLAHHFDFRGLIGKGLAIAVTQENNPYKD